MKTEVVHTILVPRLLVKICKISEIKHSTFTYRSRCKTAKLQQSQKFVFSFLLKKFYKVKLLTRNINIKRMCFMWEKIMVAKWNICLLELCCTFQTNHHHIPVCYHTIMEIIFIYLYYYKLNIRLRTSSSISWMFITFKRKLLKDNLTFAIISCSRKYNEETFIVFEFCLCLILYLDKKKNFYKIMWNYEWSTSVI